MSKLHSEQPDIHHFHSLESNPILERHVYRFPEECLSAMTVPTKEGGRRQGAWFLSPRPASRGESPADDAPEVLPF